MREKKLYTDYIDSPAGLIELTTTETGLHSLYFVKEKKENISSSKILTEVKKQLEEYFSKKRKQFSIPFDIDGTDFQTRVWNELLKIPYGKTISYLHLAKKLGDAKAIRAVGTANGKNPISIIIPCHRVIGTNGDLIGYGGGLYKKKFLLELEGALIQKELFA